jgi:hypothetical protein
MDLKIFYPPAPLAMPAISLQDFTAERLLAGREVFLERFATLFRRQIANN